MKYALGGTAVLIALILLIYGACRPVHGVVCDHRRGGDYWYDSGYYVTVCTDPPVNVWIPTKEYMPPWWELCIAETDGGFAWRRVPYETWRDTEKGCYWNDGQILPAGPEGAPR